ncbi:hypothetical protein GGS23DRAFT_579374 [Durotheca rogersii]|uniref:uncharacterized protein n=1 Tax=Durotheca rogersii TaxID=419775 RepID=UPI00221F860E|nr:uncharacterized protein GGS23DRAFT_579374 [Durotheca rogersii]KAI5860891.1 hypothetical protein GGS23DRAFT_579374 [Durotheca rogersii]
MPQAMSRLFLIPTLKLANVRGPAEITVACLPSPYSGIEIVADDYGHFTHRLPTTSGIHRFRVQLNEIAELITQMSACTIVGAAASLRPGPSPDLLVAFIVFDDGFTRDRAGFIK